ncbi:histone methyltransferase set1 [Conglomerata obtusa]
MDKKDLPYKTYTKTNNDIHTQNKKSIYIQPKFTHKVKDEKKGFDNINYDNKYPNKKIYKHKNLGNDKSKEQLCSKYNKAKNITLEKSQNVNRDKNDTHLFTNTNKNNVAQALIKSIQYESNKTHEDGCKPTFKEEKKGYRNFSDTKNNSNAQKNIITTDNKLNKIKYVRTTNGIRSMPIHVFDNTNNVVKEATNLISEVPSYQEDFKKHDAKISCNVIGNDDRRPLFRINDKISGELYKNHKHNSETGIADMSNSDLLSTKKFLTETDNNITNKLFTENYVNTIKNETIHNETKNYYNYNNNSYDIPNVIEKNSLTNKKEILEIKSEIILDDKKIDPLRTRTYAEIEKVSENTNNVFHNHKEDILKTYDLINKNQETNKQNINNENNKIKQYNDPMKNNTNLYNNAKLNTDKNRLSLHPDMSDFNNKNYNKGEEMYNRYQNTERNRSWPCIKETPLYRYKRPIPCHNRIITSDKYTKKLDIRILDDYREMTYYRRERFGYTHIVKEKSFCFANGIPWSEANIFEFLGITIVRNEQPVEIPSKAVMDSIHSRLKKYMLELENNKDEDDYYGKQKIQLQEKHKLTNVEQNYDEENEQYQKSNLDEKKNKDEKNKIKDGLGKELKILHKISIHEDKDELKLGFDDDKKILHKISIQEKNKIKTNDFIEAGSCEVLQGDKSKKTCTKDNDSDRNNSKRNNVDEIDSDDELIKRSKRRNTKKVKIKSLVDDKLPSEQGLKGKHTEYDTNNYGKIKIKRNNELYQNLKEEKKKSISINYIDVHKCNDNNYKDIIDVENKPKHKKRRIISDSSSNKDESTKKQKTNDLINKQNTLECNFVHAKFQKEIDTNDFFTRIKKTKIISEDVVLEEYDHDELLKRRLFRENIRKRKLENDMYTNYDKFSNKKIIIHNPYKSNYINLDTHNQFTENDILEDMIYKNSFNDINYNDKNNAIGFENKGTIINDRIFSYNINNNYKTKDQHDIDSFKQDIYNIPLVVKDSKIHQKGLFTLSKICRDEIIGEYVGEIISKGESDRREKNYTRSGKKDVYMFGISENCIVDATRFGSKLRFVNHSCDPNCYAEIKVFRNGVKRVFIGAERNIEVEEELTIDYQFKKVDGEDPVLCLCKSSKCRGFIDT